MQDAEHGRERFSQTPTEYDSYVFWRESKKLLKQHQDAKVHVMEKDLDALLIFAGLFSSVNSAIIGVSLDTLSAGPSDETNLLLRQIIASPGNLTLPDTSFSVTPDAIRTNIFFSLSLSLSLMSGFGAVMGKQWLRFYSQTTHTTDDQREAMERSRKVKGAERWRLQFLLQGVIPTLLQVALGLFLVGIVDYLWSLNRTVALVNLALISTGFFALLMISLFTLFDADCPFQTPLSRAIHPLAFDLFSQLIPETFYYFGVLFLRCISPQSRDPSVQDRWARWLYHPTRFYFRFAFWINRVRGDPNNDGNLTNIIAFMAAQSDERHVSLATLQQIAKNTSARSLRRLHEHYSGPWEQISYFVRYIMTPHLHTIQIDVDCYAAWFRAFLHIFSAVTPQDRDPYFFPPLIDHVIKAVQKADSPSEGVLQELTCLAASYSRIFSSSHVPLAAPFKYPPPPVCLAAEIKEFLFASHVGRLSQLKELWHTVECFCTPDVVLEPSAIGLISYVLGNLETLEMIAQLVGKARFDKVAELELHDGLWAAYTVTDPYGLMQYAHKTISNFKITEHVIATYNIMPVYIALIRGCEPVMLHLLQVREIGPPLLKTCMAMSEMLMRLACSGMDSSACGGDTEHWRLRTQLQVTLSACISSTLGIPLSGLDVVLGPEHLWPLLASVDLEDKEQAWICTAALSILVASDHVDVHGMQEYPHAAVGLVKCLQHRCSPPLKHQTLEVLSRYFTTCLNAAGAEGYRPFLDSGLLPVLLFPRTHFLPGLLSEWLGGASTILNSLLRWPECRKQALSTFTSLPELDDVNIQASYEDSIYILLKAWDMSQRAFVLDKNVDRTLYTGRDNSIDGSSYWLSYEIIEIIQPWLKRSADAIRRSEHSDLMTLLHRYIDFAKSQKSADSSERVMVLVRAYEDFVERSKTKHLKTGNKQGTNSLWVRISRKIRWKRNSCHGDDESPA